MPVPRGRLALLAAGVACVVMASIGAVSLALQTDTTQIQSSTFSTDTLNAPPGLGATGGLSISLSWTATVDTYASGHRVYRATAAGGPYSQVAEVTPRTTVSHVDNPGIGTFYYVVRAYYQSWESVESGEVSCSRTVLLYTC